MVGLEGGGGGGVDSGTSCGLRRLGGRVEACCGDVGLLQAEICAYPAHPPNPPIRQPCAADFERAQVQALISKELEDI